MSEKIKILELASRKAANDSAFIAYFLKKYSEFEKISESEILTTLRCSKEDYYKLNLCRVPDINAGDFVMRLNKIAKYTNTCTLDLNKIIKRANSILRLTGSDVEQNSYLMAARDNHYKNKREKK
jgi:hypothetical protein